MTESFRTCAEAAEGLSEEKGREEEKRLHGKLIIGLMGLKWLNIPPA